MWVKYNVFYNVKNIYNLKYYDFFGGKNYF